MTTSPCELYLYTPNLPLAIIGVILFSSLVFIHTMRIIQAKIWTGIFFVLGALAQVVGYTTRLLSTQDLCNRGAYGTQSVFLLLGPTLIMFSVNLTQTEFARTLGAENFCWVPVLWQRPLNLSINTVLILIQAVGGIMIVGSTSISTISIGSKITIAVYVIQTAFWGFIFAENISMTIQLRRHPTEPSKHAMPNWKRWNQLFGLSTSIIAFGRNIMRLTMAGGIMFLIENEWPSYAFDGFQMVVVLGVWAIWYLPGKCSAIRKETDYLSLTRLEGSDNGVV